MSPEARAAATPITITHPDADGATFDGTANGRCSPDDSRVTCSFEPNGSGTTPKIDGSVTVTANKWSATFDMTGVGSTTSGFLKAVNLTNSNSEAHWSDLVWTAPQQRQTTTKTAS